MWLSRLRNRAADPLQGGIVEQLSRLLLLLTGRARAGRATRLSRGAGAAAGRLSGLRLTPRGRGRAALNTDLRLTLIGSRIFGDIGSRSRLLLVRTEAESKASH
jgi:hypothetical protein